MRPASPDPFRLPLRVLAAVGAASLGAITLVDSGATRMYATPWTWLLVAALAAPVAALGLRLLSSDAWRAPSLPWLLAGSAVALVPVASALASPFSPPSLLAASLPLAAAALFLLLTDWLAGDPAVRRARLELILAAGAALAAVASTVYWARGLVGKPAEVLLSRVVFDIRNPHPLGHSNYTAGLMLLGLPWLVLAAKRAAGLRRIGWIVAAALAALALFASGSRGGLLGLAALGVAGLAMAGLGWRRFTAAAVAALALVAVTAVANPRVRALLAPPDPAAAPNDSTVQRAAMLHAGALMGWHRPVLGWGPGTTPLVYPRYRPLLDGGVENALQLHSTPVHLWAETGAAGLLVALAATALAALGWRRHRVAAATLAGYGAFALTDFQLDVPVFAAALAALGALLAAPGEPATGKLRAALGVTGLVLAGLVAGFGRRDPAPLYNQTALQLAPDPTRQAQAVAFLRESLKLNPDQEIAHFNLGWLLLVPDPVQAERHFLATAHLVPDKGGAYFGLGLARLNQGRNAAAAEAFALECINDPRFLASPWWNVPAIAAQRDATEAAYVAALSQAFPETNSIVTWPERQARLLLTLAPRLGRPSAGPEVNYRRTRPGYPVLMRNLDLAVPTDLYDVREDPRFPASVPFPLPSKGWLPSPRLLNLLDHPARR